MFYGNQGDVHIGKLDSFPDGNRVIDDQCKRGILAFGELSGHVHELEDLSAVEVFRLEQYKDLVFIDVKETVNLRHGKQLDFKGREADQDYHKKVSLPPGKYVSGIVPETDHLTGVIRRVVD